MVIFSTFSCNLEFYLLCFVAILLNVVKYFHRFPLAILYSILFPVDYWIFVHFFQSKQLNGKMIFLNRRCIFPFCFVMEITESFHIHLDSLYISSVNKRDFLPPPKKKQKIPIGIKWNFLSCDDDDDVSIKSLFSYNSWRDECRDGPSVVL